MPSISPPRSGTWAPASRCCTAGRFTPIRALGSIDASPLEDFHRLTRDLYIAPSEPGFWQGALRDPSEPEFEAARAAIVARQRFGIQILYGDHEGGQRTISMFAVSPREDGTWTARSRATGASTARGRARASRT